MGGYGSGRPSSGRTRHQPMAFDLANIGKVKPGLMFGFTYRTGGDLFAKVYARCMADREGGAGHLDVAVEAFHYGDAQAPRRVSIPLTETATQFGGRRLWLRCPRCSGRCRVLFGVQLRCRTCSHHAYRSQSESASDRACRRMHKIRNRLTGGEGASDMPDKPLGMHWSTYNRLADEHAEQESRWAAAILSSPIFRRLAR